MKAHNQLTPTASELALALAFELKSSDVYIQGIAPLFFDLFKSFKIYFNNKYKLKKSFSPGPIEKETKYKTEKAIFI